MDGIEELLKQCRTVAVVGLSSSPERASYRVAAYLREAGYRVIAVNPREAEVFGEKCYANLSAIPENEKIDLVDVFRRAEDVPPVVEEAIHIGARAIWMQLGIVNEEAAERARRAGLTVVMDACIMREHQALKGR